MENFWTINSSTKKSDALELLLTNLVNEYNYLSKTGFLDHFNKMAIDVKKQKHTYEAALLPENKDRNKYANILPQDATRVSYPSLPYINANYVDKKKYIVTQGPEENYLSEFWQMVWESNSRFIVSLARENENGTEKYYPYFNDDKPLVYGNFSVTVKKIKTIIADTLVYRKIIVKTNNWLRVINHLHFIGWPDFDVPDVDQFLKLCTLVNEIVPDQDNLSKNPIIVHCSAGIGRSGTFCVVHKIINTLQNNSSQNNSSQNNSLQINLTQIVYDLRNDRSFLVQTPEQFEFCYKAIIEAIKRLLDKKLID